MNQLKGVCAVLMLSLLMTRYAIADDACFEQCINACNSLPMPCLNTCVGKCPHDPVAQKVMDPRYHCMLGCSLDQCAQYTNDTEQMTSCMHDCSHKNCDPTAPTPSTL